MPILANELDTNSAICLEKAVNDDCWNIRSRKGTNQGGKMCMCMCVPVALFLNVCVWSNNVPAFIHREVERA